MIKWVNYNKRIKSVQRSKLMMMLFALIVTDLNGDDFNKASSVTAELSVMQARSWTVVRMRTSIAY